MATRIELDRINISKDNQELKNELVNKGYTIHRKSKNTIILVLWGREKTSHELEQENAEADASFEAYLAKQKEEKARFQAAKRAARKEAQKELTIANLWRLFKGEKEAYLTTKKNTFYFVINGKKVRVSDHEGCNFASFTVNPESFAKSKNHEASDFSFIISDLEGSAEEAYNQIMEEVK